MKRIYDAKPMEIVEATAITVLAIVAAELIKATSYYFNSVFDGANLSLLFLIAVMAVSLRGGMIAGLWSTALGVIVDVMFYHPLFADRPESLITVDIVNLALFAIAGTVSSLIGGEAREHLRRVRANQDVRVREAREHLRTAMLSSVSHDLKTPLAAVIGALDVYRQVGDTLPAERKAELMQTALVEARRLDGLITNILDMAKLETDAVRYRMEWYDARSILQNAIRAFAQRAPDRHIELVGPEGLWELEVDASMLERALFQLIDNAVKYTTGDIRVIVETGDAFTIKICDEGPGIPPEQREAVFDKYTRLNQADRKVAGTGLGLPIARMIAEAHHGTLSLETPAEGGACFALALSRFRTVKSV